MKSFIDTWLERTSQVAQVAIAAVAIFGYFYTVRPVYQKEMLTESIAEKQLEVSKLERARGKLESLIISKDKLLSEHDEKIERAVAESEALIEKNKALHEEIKSYSASVQKLKTERDKLTKEIAAQTSESRKFYTDDFILKLQQNSVFRFGFRSMADTKVDPFDRFDEFRAKVTSPYDSIKQDLSGLKVSFIDNIERIPLPIRQKVMKTAHSLLETRKNSLQSAVDFNRISSTIDEYNIEKNKLRSNQNSEKAVLTTKYRRKVHEIVSKAREVELKMVEGFFLDLMKSVKL